MQRSGILAVALAYIPGGLIMDEKEIKKIEKAVLDIMEEIERWQKGKIRTGLLKDRIFSIVRDILRGEI